MMNMVNTVRQLFLFLLLFSVIEKAQINPYSLTALQNFDTLQVVSFSTVGDLMVHSTQFRYAQIDSLHFNFNPVFKFVKKYLSQSDYTMGNLETVTAGAEIGWRGYPKFNTPDEFVEALKNAGFDILFTSNNHALDQGDLGVKRTIRVINKNGMLNVGTHKKSEKDYLIFYHGLLKIALVSFSYGTNGFTLPDSSNYEINLIRRKRIRRDLKTIAMKENPDLTIVYYHFGTEYKRVPSDYQLDYVNYAFRYGADIVIGSHPHVIQPVAFWKNSKKFNGRFVAYSLGNFISNQTWRYSDCGVILNFTIAKNLMRDSTYLAKISFIPTWVYKGKNEKGKKSYYILPYDILQSDSIPAFLSDDAKLKFIESIHDTEAKINEMNANISTPKPISK